MNISTYYLWYPGTNSCIATLDMPDPTIVVWKTTQWYYYWHEAKKDLPQDLIDSAIIVESLNHSQIYNAAIHDFYIRCFLDKDRGPTLFFDLKNVDVELGSTEDSLKDIKKYIETVKLLANREEKGAQVDRKSLTLTYYGQSGKPVITSIDYTVIEKLGMVNPESNDPLKAYRDIDSVSTRPIELTNHQYPYCRYGRTTFGIPGQGVGIGTRLSHYSRISGPDRVVLD